MSDIRAGVPLANPARAEQTFPTLKPAQIGRIAAHGRVRRVEAGEMLVEAGERAGRFFVVISGRIEVVRQVTSGEELVTVHRPGQFSGDVSMLSGRRVLVTIRAVEPG